MTAHVAPQTAPTVAAPEPKAVRAEEEATVDDSARPWPGADFSQVPVRTGRERRDPDEEGQVSEVLDSPGTPLDTEARSLLEPRFGRDFSRVRVHTGTKAAESAAALAARAYTVGQDIVFGAGRYAPNTTAGMRLLAHELTHTLQQPVAAPGVARSGLRLGDTADPAEHEAELVADQVLRNAPLERPISFAGHHIRRQPTTAADPDTHADVLPPPRTVVWSTDRFTVSFARTGRPGNTQLEMTIRYTGPRTVVSSPVAKATVSIGEKPLAVRLLDNGPTSLALDLYGDGKKIVEVRDEAHLSQLPSGPGRSHSFDAVVDQQTVFAASLTVLDPRAKQADLVPAPRPEHAGENPRVEGVRFGRGGWRILLDGDGDQDKELQVTLSTPTAGTLSVEAVQRSTGATRTVTLPVPTGSGPLSPIVEEVTDGHAPNRIRLFAAPSGPALLLGPGTHVPAASTYPAAIGNDTANLLFPPEPKPRRKIAAAGETKTAAGITATDVALGAYRDVFRLSVRQNPDGKTATLGLSALNDGTVRDTAGTPLSLSGPLRFSVLTTGTTGLDLDLDGDGKADLRIFDRLSTPTDADGGGPPARARNHQIRVAGPAVGGERTFDFRYRYGTLQGANATAGPVSIEASRNAEAVGRLAGRGPAGRAADMLDQVEIEMLGLRRRSVDLGLVARAVFDKNLALWQALVELRAQLAQGVSAPARARAVAAVAGYAGAVRANETQPTTEQYVLLAELTKAAESGNWPALFGAYSNAMATFDTVLRERLEKRGGQDAKAAGQLGDLRRELNKMPANAILVPATFHPDERFRTEQGFASTVSLQLYAWQDDSAWHLRDLTNPAQPFAYSIPKRVDTPLPPMALFAALDDPDHFPAGAVNVQVPGGAGGQVAVRDHLTWKKFFAYLGLGLAAVGVTLAAFASAGTGALAVPAAWALAGSALAGATAAGIDLAERITQDRLDARTALLDIAQIVAGLSGAGAIAAGRIVLAAGTAPAAARWAGAWANVAVLAQRAYLPLTVTAAASDVVTVVVLAPELVTQLDEIAKSTASDSDKARAKTLLLVQAATMAGLTLLQLKGIGPLGRGETLVLSPGPAGVPVVSPAVRAGTRIIDSNVAIALGKRARGLPLQSNEQALLNRFDALGAADVRVPDKTITEATAKGGPLPQRGFAVGVDRTGPEYQALLAELTTAQVGAAKGAADREIVADAFFAVGEPGTKPSFATADPGVFNKLYSIKVAKEGGTALAKLGAALPEAAATKFGFDVTINGRTLNVLPLPKR